MTPTDDNEGNGISLARFAADAATLSTEAFGARHGVGFLLVESIDLDDDDEDGEESESARVTLRTARPTAPADARVLVFPLRRKETSTFDFVAVGRNEGNDVHLPHRSVSRFHAYIRQTDVGFVVQDAKSAFGTIARGQDVPAQGEGEPVPLVPGGRLRFGDVDAVYLDAAGLCDAAKREGGSL